IEPGVPKDTLINVAKYQFPTILFPYLRSTVTSFFANAGFGTFIFPLINVVELAKKLLTDNEIEEL
ncbi:MAG: protein-export chaperone SecB, partial [Spirochaetaceae bacterium]|nr:protein-export chaperone SecB [Spirochaetaceae bacterium]